MESNFYNDELEELIKQKADQYKLYPSDKVWKRIYSSLHTGRKWFVAGMALLITGILFFAGKELLAPNTNIASIKKPVDNLTLKNQPSESEKTESEKDNVNKLPITPDFSAFNSENSKTKNTDSKLIPENPILASDIFGDDNLIKTNDNLVTENNILSIVPGKINPEITSRVIENYPLPDNSNLVKVSGDAVTHSLTAEAESKEISAKEELKKINWLQENASYALAKMTKKSRFQLQEYLSPTASFRTLSGGGNYNIPESNVHNIPIALTHLGNPNDYVDHKPAVGFEVGASMVYRLTRNISLKTGLQFNYSRYTIEAYSSYYAQPATITLNAVYGSAPNAITRYTNVQNFGGNSTQTLQNEYFDLSAPIGLEVKILGNEKLQFSIAATLEPTYLLNRNSYLLATDYSNYIKDPALFRRWNFNGGIEAFASYKLGKLRLQLGPQFRYQLLSTFVGAYPIKENLKEYGLKIGLTKSIF
jgi:hypothetical protein